MKFYTTQHKYYCGIDLHAEMMHVCILDQKGEILVHRKLGTDQDVFLKTLNQYREDLVIAVECRSTWYWLAKLCAREKKAEKIIRDPLTLLFGLDKRRPYKC